MPTPIADQYEAIRRRMAGGTLADRFDKAFKGARPINCREAYNAAEALRQAFDWNATSEGDTQWRRVYERLIAISQGAKL